MFLRLLSCFSVFLNTSPFFSLHRPQVYPGGGCSVPELSHQSKYKCMSGGPDASWFSLCLFVPLCFNICLSMPPLFWAHLLLQFHLVLKMIWLKNGVCAALRHTQLQQIFYFLQLQNIKTDFQTKNN